MEESTISFLDYWHVFLKRKTLIIGLSFTCTLTVLVVTLFQPKIYLAQATFLVLQRDTGSGISSSIVSQLGNLPFPISTGGDLGQNYEEILNSNVLAREIIKKAGLLEKYRKENPGLTKDQLVRSLRSGLNVKQNNRGMFTVEYEHQNPGMAAEIANAYVDGLRQFLMTKTLTNTKKNRLFVESQLARVKNVLTQSEVKLKNFQLWGLNVPEGGLAVLDSEKISTQLQLKEVTAALNESERQFKTKTKLDKSIAINSVIQELQGRLTGLELELAKMQTTLTSDHPDVVLKQREIEDVKEKLNEQVQKIVAGETLSSNPGYESLRSSIISSHVLRIGLLAKDKALSQLLAKRDRLLTKVPGQTLEQQRIIREVAINDQVYRMLVQELEKVKILENKDEPSFEVLDRAEPPPYKHKPQTKKTAMLAFISSLAGSVFLAFFMEYIESEKKKRIFSHV